MAYTIHQDLAPHTIGFPAVFADALVKSQVTFAQQFDVGQTFKFRIVTTHFSGGVTSPNEIGRGLGHLDSNGRLAVDSWEARNTGNEYVMDGAAPNLDPSVQYRCVLSDSDAVTLSDVTPQALGTAGAGTGTRPSRDDHVHPMPTAENVGADPAGTASAAMTAHTSASDPHSQYTTALSGHVSAADPHPQYATDVALQAHKDAVNPHMDYARTMPIIQAGTVIVIGDSNLNGTGLTNGKDCWGEIFGRAVAQSGNGRTKNPGYTRLVNFESASGYFVNTGSPNTTYGEEWLGCDYAAGQYFDFAGWEFDYLDLIVTAAAPVTVTVTTNAVASEVTNTTIATTTLGIHTLNFASRPTTAMATRLLFSAAVTVWGVRARCKSSLTEDINFWRWAMPGKSWPSLVTTNNLARFALIANHANTPNVHVILAMGTNSIYTSPEHQTPAQYTASMTAALTQLAAQCPGKTVTFTIAQPGIPSNSPVAEPRADFDAAIDTWLAANPSVGVIDFRRVLNPVTPDGVHCDPKTHYAMARIACQTLGISMPLTAKQMTIYQAPANETTVLCTYLNAATQQSGLRAARITHTGNLDILSGHIQLNGSATCLNVPGVAAVTYYLITRSNLGLCTMRLQSGTLVIEDATLPAWVALDGIVLDRRT